MLLLLVAFLTGLIVQWRSASKLVHGDNFLRADEGVGFLVTDVLLRGGALYKDIAYPYGYLPAYLHAAAAWISGNTIATYLHLFLALDVVILGGLYLLLRRVLGPWTAFLFAVGVMIPQTIIPGSVSGAGLSNVAYPLEKIPLLVVALLWSAPRRQPWWRALLIGGCLGGMQGIKFGTGIVAGVALVLVDLVSWYRSGPDDATGRIVWRNLLAALAGFLAVQGVWIAVALASLPRAVALDVLWPTYMCATYGAYSGPRFPGWYGLDYFVGVEMIPLLGGLGSLWWLGTRAIPLERRSQAPVSPSVTDVENGGGILFLLVFFLLASFVLFKGNWHFFNFAWIPVLGGAYLLLQPSQAVRRAVIVLWCAGFARFLLADPRNEALPLYPLTLDNGEQIWASLANRNAITDVVSSLRAPVSGPDAGKARPVVFYPLGAGFHVFFHLPRGGRNTWYAPGLVRPYDVPKIEELARTARWVVWPVHHVGSLSPDPGEWDRADNLRGNTFDASLRQEVQSQLRLEHDTGGTAWIFSHPP